LVEDSALFLRYVLERLTRDRQEEMFKLLRHLIRFIPKLPQQAAFALYNYIIGYVMFYVRSPQEDGQRLIGTALSILWMVVHSVHGIMFKDLKQILRKEQCDASILLTANVPSAKKIVVHGPQGESRTSPFTLRVAPCHATSVLIKFSSSSSQTPMPRAYLRSSQSRKTLSSAKFSVSRWTSLASRRIGIRSSSSWTTKPVSRTPTLGMFDQ
jgi:hypothetical protein